MKKLSQIKSEIKTKLRLPAFGTVFGKHSVEVKEKLPSMETSFGKHSEPTKNLKEEYKDEASTHRNTEFKPADDEELNHVFSYSKHSAFTNKHLHDNYNNDTPTDEHVKNHIDTLTDALNRHKTKRDITVYTGTRRSPSEHFKPGQTEAHVHLPAFTSTSTSEHLAGTFSKTVKHENDKNHGIDHKKYGNLFGEPEHGARHILKIHVPKGSSGASIRKHAKYKEENEFLLNRGHNIKIHHKPEKLDSDTYLWHAHITGHEPKDIV